MTRLAKQYINGSFSLAQHVNHKSNANAKPESCACSASLAHESCQTSLSMTEMQVVSSLAQLVSGESNSPPLESNGSPLVYISSESSSSSGRSGPMSTSPPAASARSHAMPSQIMCPHVGFRVTMPRFNREQPSPSKAPGKAKWNSTVRCNWPPEPPESPTRGAHAGGAAGAAVRTPSSPTRVAGGAAPSCVAVPGRLTSAPETRTRNVGVMTFAAINAGELIQKVENLELRLDVHVRNERQLLSVNEQLRKRLEECLREMNDAGMMNVQLDNLNDEMERILQLLRSLSERNAVLEKEKAQVQAKLQRESALNKMQASKMLMHRQMEDHDVDLCDAECQTICFCQQVDTRKRRRERKRWSTEEETLPSNQSHPRPLSPPTQTKKADITQQS